MDIDNFDRRWICAGTDRFIVSHLAGHLHRSVTGIFIQGEYAFDFATALRDGRPNGIGNAIVFGTVDGRCPS
ncbi:MAG: hypothetical protein R2849_13520 [Thermomicrobiales bacterium]